VVARRYAGQIGFFWLCVLLLSAPSASVRGEPGVPDPALALSGSHLSQALRQGGFVIYFRHADTGPAYPEPGPVDLERCETQRNLNDKGRAEARVIGEQLRRLQVGIGTVLSSEFCRCWQTAELAVGRYEKTRALTGVGRGPEAAGRREEAIRALRKLLGTVPATGTNTLLFSHGFNLLDLENFHLGTQGEAAIFRPDGRGGYALVARVTPEQWVLLPDAPGAGQ